MKLYSYVVEHDNGYAPNPYFGVCTLCRCKFEGRRNIVPLANVGDWVIGTGGASKRSAGHGKLVYAMRVDEKLTRWEYFIDRRFQQKKPAKTGTYEQTRGDNVSPHGDFEKHEQFALLSRHFYYFGAKAIDVPKEFDIEKRGPGFRSHFSPSDISRFIEWLQTSYTWGKQGEPCYRVSVDRSAGSKRCGSSC